MGDIHGTLHRWWQMHTPLFGGFLVVGGLCDHLCGRKAHVKSYILKTKNATGQEFRKGGPERHGTITSGNRTWTHGDWKDLGTCMFSSKQPGMFKKAAGKGSNHLTALLRNTNAPLLNLQRGHEVEQEGRSVDAEEGKTHSWPQECWEMA